MWHICNEGPGFDLMKDEQLLATGSEPSCMVRNGYDWLGHVRIKHWLFRAQLPSPWHLCFLELLASGCASLARVQPPEGDYYDELPSGFVNILALQVDCLWHSASDDFFLGSLVWSEGSFGGMQLPLSPVWYAVNHAMAPWSMTRGVAGCSPHKSRIGGNNLGHCNPERRSRNVQHRGIWKVSPIFFSKDTLWPI